MVCPFCQGGSSHEKSLALTHTDDGALLFICHRAHCGVRGSLGGTSIGSGERRQPPVRRESVPYREHIGHVPQEVAAEVQFRWHFERFPDHWRWNYATERIMYPVLSPKAERRGYVARTLGGSTPKSLNYKELLNQPWCHWASVVGPRVWVVEDIASAERLAQRHQAAVSLVGVHAASDVVEEMLFVAGKRPIMVALDRDALRRSLDIASMLRLRSRAPVLVSVLSKDIKDMNPEELTDCLRSGY